MNDLNSNFDQLGYPQRLQTDLLPALNYTKENYSSMALVSFDDFMNFELSRDERFKAFENLMDALAARQSVVNSAAILAQAAKEIS